ncbi:hypothetical protein AAFF_G00397660 [Aldrovandia affinis]|uniref:Uncharacterized protein n=1 Tax=Aldrovandia affinis TaxID=143900 RepID=A0AAD7SDP1_9TELE|nr:hypothetical protein AAFF_G00397660 [Aldrovandia affinis]
MATRPESPGRKRQRRVAREKTRRQHGEYHRLVQELRLDGERFQRYFRLDRAQFDELLTRVGPRITRLDTNWRSPISAAERLAICLRVGVPSHSVEQVTSRQVTVVFLKTMDAAHGRQNPLHQTPPAQLSQEIL